MADSTVPETNATDQTHWVDPLEQPEEARAVLVRAVQRTCPQILATEREDLVQEALTKLISLSSGEQNRTFSRSYLWKVAYSSVADALSKVQRRQAATPLEESREAEGVATRVSIDPFETLKLGEAIQQCLRALRENRRVVVQLRLLGHDLAEIERLTEQSAKRVRNLVYRGLANLRQCLVSKGFGP